MALPQVAILSNPWCAHNKKFMPRINKVISESKNIFHFVLDEDATIPEAINQFARTKPALLIINGGDTTIHTALNYLKNNNPFEKMPVLAVLATGKANKLAHDLGLGGKPNEVLARLINIAQVEGIKKNISNKSLIKLDAGNGDAPYYGVYFKGGAMLEQNLYFQSALLGVKFPKFLASFLANILVLLLSIGHNKLRKDTSKIYVPQCKIKLKGAGEMSGRCFTLLATTLDKLPSKRTPFGRFGKGKVGFLVVEYGFMSAFRAFKGKLFDKIGKESILGLDTRRSDFLTISGLRTVSLDGEIIEITDEQSITIDGRETLPFISLNKTKD